MVGITLLRNHAVNPGKACSGRFSNLWRWLQYTSATEAHGGLHWLSPRGGRTPGSLRMTITTATCRRPLRAHLSVVTHTRYG